MGTVFEIWNYCVLIGFGLLFFRKDANEVISEILSMIFTPNFLGAIFSLILIYCFMPLTVPYSIMNIIKNK